jgi:photosystem I subunit 3
MKINFNKFLKSIYIFLISFCTFNYYLGNNLTQAKETLPYLVECKNSTNFERRLNTSIKKFENRIKLYEEKTPQSEFLEKEISLTNARFENYKKSNLLCGKEGLPHLITNGDFNHFNEFGLPALAFLYITGWIGWSGRKYLQYSSTTENSFESEIIINVPVAFPIIISGFLWPIEAWKEFISGQLIVNDDDVTVSPR